MKKNKYTMSNRMKWGIVTFIVVAGLFEMVTVSNLNRMKANILDINCQIINTDSTRPDERECVNPLSLDKGLFKFKTAEGRIEVYEVIPITDNQGRTSNQLVFKEYADM